MIKANELRIGNWVNWKISGRDDRVAAPILLSITPDFGKHIDPIPLSAEILEKAGFLCLNYETRKEYSIGEFRISSYPSGEFTFMWNGQVVYIKSVHQLQNLFWALTGEELPVKL